MSRYMKYWYLLFMTVFCVKGYAQTDSIVPFEQAYKRVYNITKINDGSRPVIDGRLDEDFWTKQGVWSEPFVQSTPFDRNMSDSPTKVKLFYDNKYIYVGINCKDAVPEKMNAFISNRDDNSHIQVEEYKYLHWGKQYYRLLANLRYGRRACE